MKGSGDLDRRLQFRRAALITDGFGTRLNWNVSAPEADNLGSPVWGSRRDVSDGEKAGAGTVFAEISARFVIRSSSFTRAITPQDRLVEGGRVFEIIGIKEMGRRDRLEITAVARADQ